MGSAAKAKPKEKKKKNKGGNDFEDLGDAPADVESKKPIEVTAESLADEEWGPVKEKKKKDKKGKGKKGKQVEDEDDEEGEGEQKGKVEQQKGLLNLESSPGVVIIS